MKKQIYYIIFLVIILSITAFNTVLSLQSNNKLSALAFSVIDAIAGNETDSLAPGESIAPGSDLQKVETFDCMHSKNVVVALDQNGNSIIEKITVPGKIGICNGDQGPCEKYSCTESLIP